MNLFGKGGKVNQEGAGLTGPVPLDIQNPRNSIEKKIPNNINIGLGNRPSYQNSNEGSRALDLSHEYSDMSEADKVEDERIKGLRIESYKLVNEEKKLDIKNKHEFSLIAKVSAIVLACILTLSFIAYFFLFSLLSIKNGEIAETGIFGNILDTFVNILKIFL